MATTQATALKAEGREPAGSRAARRLRRAGSVPGVVYGGGEDPLCFQVEAKQLRQVLAHTGAVIDLSIDGAKPTPVVVKELSRHPVSGEVIHVDLLRVRLDRPIHAAVVVHLVGAEDAPGVKEGGVLEQVMREVTIEALPTDIPDALEHDVSGVQIGDTITVGALNAPPGVTLLDDPEIMIATVTPPRLQAAEEAEIEEETELVAEGAPAEEVEGAEDGGAGGESEGGGE
jgi:large subunit ribosomal protein L25